MNKTFASFVIVCIVLVLAVEVQGRRNMFHIKTYHIINNITGQNINAHCYSKSDDFGDKVLGPGQEFVFTFRPNLLGFTRFHCRFVTGHGSGSYGVYTPKSMQWCRDPICKWYARPNGLCAIGYSRSCQAWKEPPRA